MTIGSGRTAPRGEGAPADVSVIGGVLRRVSNGELRDLAGSGGFSRGSAYARQNRVAALRVLGPRRLTARVRGSGRHHYTTQVELSDDGFVVAGACSCPLGGACKHIVAVVLTARETLGLAGAASPAPAAPRPVMAAWERLLGDLLAGPVAAQEFTPVALLLVEQSSTAAFGDRTGSASQLVARPLVPGKSGWIKTGLSWNTLARPGRVRLDPRHRQALERLCDGAGDRYRYRYYQPEWLQLDAVDGWLSALHACRRAGIELVTDQRHSLDVVLGQEPARVGLDLARTTDGAVTVTPSVVLPDEFEELPEEATTGWVPVGAPVTGLWHRSDEALRLVEFDPPLDPATARVLQSGQIVVPTSDVSRFLTGSLPRLAQRIAVTSEDATVPIATVGPPRLHLSLTHRPGLRLALDWEIAYPVGDATVTVPIGRDPDGEHDGLRDITAEQALLASVSGALPAPSTLPGLAHLTPDGRVHPEPHAEFEGFDVVRFLRDVLPDVEALPDVEVSVHGEVVEYAEATEAPSVRLTLTEPDGVDGVTDWFDLGVEVGVADEQVPIGDLVRAFTLGEDHLLLASGTWFRIDRPELADLRRLIEEARALQDDPEGPLRLSAYHADLWSELEQLGVVAEQSERWARLVKGLTAPAAEAVAAPEGLRATLRPYQHDGFAWLTFLRRHGLGGVLADDMGLGKTLQALAMILQDRQDIRLAHQGLADETAAPTPAPWLVVAPTSVLSTWAAEAERFAPSLRVVVLRETHSRRGTDVAEAVAGADVVVTSYSVFRLDAEQFGATAWNGLVLDEAQFVKNHRAVTYKCVRTLPVPVRFAITGTPMENNLMELWSLLSIVAPGLFPHPVAFAEHYRRPIESGSAPERLDVLRRRIRPVMMRRTKQLVAADLPPKQEQLVPVELPATHRRHYDRTLARQRQRVLGLLEDPQRNRIAILRALTVLRQTSLHPALVDTTYADPTCAKLEALMERLEPVVAEGHRVLVFSQFTRFLAMARARLDAAGIGYSYLDGRTRKRAEAIDAFKTGDTPVFLISLKAGGVGLTLTEADYVFLLDPWWNPAVEAQAVDRTHRIGQDKRVNVYRLVSAQTIEDKVVALQERKRELFATVVDEGALASGALTTDDIRALL